MSRSLGSRSFEAGLLLACWVGWGCGGSAELRPAGPSDARIEDAGLIASDAGSSTTPDAAPPIMGADAAELAPDATADAGMNADATDAAPSADADLTDAPAIGPGDGGPGDGGPGGPTGIAARCFAAIWDPNHPGPDYDQFNPIVGSHCNGTNHQNITGVERVVFLGDSVTVGTPPTPSAEFYRARLADRLVTQFNLAPPSALWKTANPLSGVASERFSGAFASCAKWGARDDDLHQDHDQIDDCFPMEQRALHTLVVMTSGGNDIASLQKNGVHGPYMDSYNAVASFVAEMRAAIHYLKDPTVFPGGVDVIFGNMYEYTDATGDVASCPAASLAGFSTLWDHPEDLEHLVIWANEQYMQIAVETQSDMVFMLENFCGHGYHNADPAGRCYRGPNTPRWFDLSCIHPNPDGHQVITDMMMSVVLE